MLLGKMRTGMRVMFIEMMVEFIDPMQVELLSALAKREGCKTFFAVEQDCNLKEEVRNVMPDIVALSAKTGGYTTTTLPYARLAKKINPQVIVIVGGPHVTFDQSLIEHEEIDIVIAGEADQAWMEVLQALANGRSVNHLRNVFTKSNWYHRFKKMQPQERSLHLVNRMETPDLDALPYLDRKLVYDKVPHLAKFPMRSFMTSRGCPYECTYCFEPKFNEIYEGKGKQHQRYSPERVIAELKDMIGRYPTQFIKFYDDIFWIYPKLEQDPWLIKFAELYRKEIHLPFFLLTRCNILTEDHLKLLKPAGLHSMTMSIEAGNEYVRSDVIKRHMNKDQILNAFDLCYKYGVKTFANTILGIPVHPDKLKELGKTNIELDIESLRINVRCRATFSEYTIIYPYAGTPFNDYVEEHGWMSKDTSDKLHHSYQSWSPLNCFTPEEKIQQVNLSSLGTVCNVVPWAESLVVNYLIKVKWAWVQRWIYHPLYFLSKGYLMMFKIYPMKLGLLNFWYLGVRAWKNEISKRSPGKNLYQSMEKQPTSNGKTSVLAKT